jgi:hypothetical protein
MAAPQYDCIHTGPRPLIAVCRSVSFGGARKPEQIAGSVVPPRNMHVFASTALNFLLQNLSR